MDTDAIEDVSYPGTTGQLEVSALIGGTLNDPFLHIPLFGYGATWHVNEILGIELGGSSTWLPAASDNCDDPRWKPIVCEALVGPGGHLPSFDPYLTHQFHAGLAMAPLNGTLYLGWAGQYEFEWYLRAGFGAAVLMPDRVDLSADGSDSHPTWLPTTDLAQGIRIGLTPHFALRAEFRTFTYIQVINDTTLEMKNYLIGHAGLSLLLGPQRKSDRAFRR